ncbi:MAG: hypothetical protein IJS80_04380 [Lachnospiraceae bacterium]|nr:hypothetical protein [Lachnospiraceae bacterium]
MMIPLLAWSEPMKEKLKDLLFDKGKRTAFDLIAGTILCDLIALPAGLIAERFFKFRYLPFCLGIISGMTVAVFMVIHMYSVLEKAVLCDKKQAKHKTKLGAFIRMLVMVGVMIAAALLPDFLSLVGVVIGILALKIAALSQPLIDKFVSKFVKKEE